MGCWASHLSCSMRVTMGTKRMVIPNPIDYTAPRHGNGRASLVHRQVMWRLGHCNTAAGLRGMLTQTAVSQHKSRNCLITPAGYILPPSTSYSPSHISALSSGWEVHALAKCQACIWWYATRISAVNQLRGKWFILAVWAVHCSIHSV